MFTGENRWKFYPDLRLCKHFSPMIRRVTETPTIIAHDSNTGNVFLMTERDRKYFPSRLELSSSPPGDDGNLALRVSFA